MPRQLGDLEDAVMTRVWQWNRPVTVREVLEDLQQERSIAYTTVMTVMDNLHQKGWVRREVEGRAYRYRAVSTRAAYAAALMNEAWSKSDNQAAALVAFFGMMSPEQRESLEDAVRIVQGTRTETADGERAAPEAPAPAPAAERAVVREENAGEETGPEESASTKTASTKTASEQTASEQSAAEEAEPGEEAAPSDKRRRQENGPGRAGTGDARRTVRPAAGRSPAADESQGADASSESGR
ncbi:BlaI/MecI/CopY family transcriptional regulator [Streptomyces sp. NBC_01497]|nr:BlaI/MecI/CopY family transcriptional regulator [Streptomyces sp. NBC_01497]